MGLDRSSSAGGQILWGWTVLGPREAKSCGTGTFPAPRGAEFCGTGPFPAPREAKSCGTEVFPAPPQTESLGPELTGPGPECTMLCSIDRPEGPNVNNLVNCPQGPNAQYSGQLTGPEGPGREFTPRYAGATLGGKLPFRVRSGLKKSTNNAARGALLAKVFYGTTSRLKKFSEARVTVKRFCTTLHIQSSKSDTNGMGRRGYRNRSMACFTNLNF